jgi:hypothetical protein
MKIEDIEKKYKFKFPKLFRQLWEDGMIDWMNGHSGEFNNNETWAATIYPEIKEKPPLLLHTGGFDFEMLRAEEMLNWKYDELWDIDEHSFIPFAKTEEGNVYAFYEGIKTNGEYAIVYIWNDMNETEVLAKNFEDFIFRKMLEAAYDIDKDELKADYKNDGFVGYKNDILRDLKSIAPYLNDDYKRVLTEVYERDDILETMFTYGLIEHDKLGQLIQEYLSFEELDSVFEHEL